ncbi:MULTISPECIES: DMT family transporter [unclassified Mycolicibacterium]|uniref:DMT family transporter n=1 Tax=unclassified Mycolicibacterium TaxID=2636767 RepID=UPI0012DC6D1F|nr:MULTISPECIES: DMT family transporter [unclassified Mycolicibacterium]MUL82594.1 DMT family transporter [Mycolicibacterium sp. CBMA 329]MUL88929.1 DMT family transporter [Mycolicibacterium sp. CBMA 331]MUL97497.1 DMT family transporter [Mycolicibacterium sp. CBMA 334]MUM26778.1 DMT family transporter [Mycolicibacterium sp. CBMA 295]MUM38445.1 DMT family transporter [Mycolicibacterium sp. CBMA 247]
MLRESSATRNSSSALSHSGLWWGLLGVTAFSFTIVFTKIANGGLSPLFIGAGRAVVAASIAVAALALTRQARPTGRQWARLAVVAAGVVAGFPLLTSYALTAVPASHGAIVVALLPAATAVCAVLRGHERPPAAFWALAAAGALAAVVFAMVHGAGFGHLTWPDLLLFGAVLAAAVGYAEGGLLARELGAWQTVSWALVVAAPVMVALTALAVVQQPPNATPMQWAAFGYLAVVSMYLGFFAWYRGLAIGPMTQVSQVQLIQPVLTIGWAALLLHERLTWSTALGGAVVIGCAALAVRVRLR